MRLFFLLLGVTSVSVFALPVKEKKEELNKDELGPADGEDLELNLEYGRYLKEVIEALESDQDFKKKLETADPDDIKSGRIARDLHFVDHNVRTKLDELKRREIERLRELAMMEHKKKTARDPSKLSIPLHVDHRNPHRFESEDLRKLITQLNSDLEQADRQRRDQFKQYEMNKNYQYEQKLKGMDEEHKKQAQSEHDLELTKHKEHPKLHHPGSRPQLEEVWEEQDHFNREDFNPKTFFHLHDLDGNGLWDENEVKALFQKELNKMYDPNAPEDDIMERYEDMERMREHVFKETDHNRDDLISFDEFMDQTNKSDFERDEGWQGLDEQNVYSQQEYEQFEIEQRAEIQRLIDSGSISPPPGFQGINPPVPVAMAHDVPAPMMGTGHQGLALHDNPPMAAPAQYQHAQGYHGVPPQGYQGVPPQGYQGIPPQGYQGIPPQGYQGIPPQGYQGVPPQGAPLPGYQGLPPQGYQGLPPQGYQGIPPQGAPLPGYQGVPPQALPQGYQTNPQGNKIPPQSNQAIHQEEPGQAAQSHQQQEKDHDNLGAAPIKPIESNKLPESK